MKFNEVRKNILVTSYFIPFRVHLVLLVLAFIAGYTWIKKSITIPDSSYSSILHLLITITLYFLLAIIIWSLLTSVIPYIVFLLNRKNKKVSLTLKTITQNHPGFKQPVSISLKPVYSPLFGFIRLRLRYDTGTLKSSVCYPLKGRNPFFLPHSAGFTTGPFRKSKNTR